MILKINNLRQQDGKSDYKGLDIDLIEPGTQLYPTKENTAYFKYNGFKNQNSDVIEITESEYIAKKNEIESTLPIPIDERVSTLETLVLQLQGVI